MCRVTYFVYIVWISSDIILCFTLMQWLLNNWRLVTVLKGPRVFVPYNKVRRFKLNKRKKMFNVQQFYFLCYNRHLPNKFLPLIATSYRQFIRTTIGGITHCYNRSSFSAGCTFSCEFFIFLFGLTSTIKFKTVFCLETFHPTHPVFFLAILGNDVFVTTFLSIQCTLPFSKAI